MTAARIVTLTFGPALDVATSVDVVSPSSRCAAKLLAQTTGA